MKTIPVDEFRKLVKSSKRTALEDRFEVALRMRNNIPPWECEHQFAKPRKWRFDFAWPDLKLAVEIQGGQWTQGAHSRGGGMNRDCEKNAHALMLGWRVLFLTGDQVRNDEGLKWLVEIIERSET